MVVSHDGRHLYTATGRGGSVAEIETATGKQLRTIEVGPRPWGIALSPDGTRLYTANGPSNDVTILDAVNLKVLAKVPVGDGPWGLVTDAVPATGQP
jgi:YVTN family beta-propeller protein